MKNSIIAVLLTFLSWVCCANDGAYWRDAKKVREGVKLKALSFKKPRLMKAWVMSIDLKTPGIGFVTTERAKEWGEIMSDYTNDVKLIRTKRESTLDFMSRKRGEGRNVEIAINTAPWVPWCSPWTHTWADPERWVVSDGVEVCAGKTPGKGALFVVYKDGRAEITSEVAPELLGRVLHSHPGFEIIATNSVAIAPRKLKDLHPRTAFGISKDRRYLYLLVVDGRQPGYSLGANLADLNDILLPAGASDILNMDGGGSTALVVLDGPSKTPRMLNRHRKGSIRSVALNFGITFD
ncbi:MAG: phosphodiester glycosidase family protein [Kiritimatiellae bacterium]|nr:phosphodiester glycosidase family protein [Kiritimatiellia bacterium]